MNNEEYIAAIMKMTAQELLDQVMSAPEELTDPYYREFGRALKARHKELSQSNPTPKGSTP